MVQLFTSIILLMLCSRASCLSFSASRHSSSRCRTRLFSAVQEEGEFKVDSSISIDADGQVNDVGSGKNSSSSSSSKRKKPEPISPPPGPETFPLWAYEPRPFFEFELLYESKKSLARVGRIHTVRKTN